MNNGYDQQPRRRGGGGLRLVAVVALLAYGAYYYFSNRTVDPYTGEQVLIDKSLDAEQESALGLQAYREILSQERAVSPAAFFCGTSVGDGRLRSSLARTEA